MHLTERSAGRPGIADLFVSDHATAEYDAVIGARKDTVCLQILHGTANGGRALADETGKHVVREGTALRRQMAVRLTLMHDRHHLYPQAARQ